MKKYLPIFNFIILFVLGFSIPELLKGNFIWLVVFIPALIFAIWVFYNIFKKD